jgi:hypothetical protein
MGRRWTTGIVAALLCACDPGTEELAETSARIDAVNLADQLRDAATHGDVQRFRITLFQELVRANGDKPSETLAAAKAVIRDGGTHGFDHVESLLLLYLDALVRRQDTRTFEAIEAAFRDVGGVRFVGPAPSFLQPMMRLGTGYVPSTDPATLRALLMAAGRSTPADYADRLGCMPETQDGEPFTPGGYEVWLSQPQTQNDVCTTVNPQSPVGAQIGASGYCNGSSWSGCAELGTEAVNDLTASACIGAGLASEFEEPSTVQDAWLACQQSMIDTLNKNGGVDRNGVPTGSSLSSCACAQGTCHCDGGVATDSGTRPPRPTGSTPGRPDSGTNGSNTNTNSNTNSGQPQPIIIKNKGGIVIVTGNNNNDQTNTNNSPTEKPEKDSSSTSWVDTVVDALISIFVKKGPSDSPDQPVTQTEACQGFERAMDAATGRHRADPTKTDRPWNDPRKTYPPPEDADAAAEAMGSLESCGADSPTFNHSDACGLTACGAGNVSSIDNGPGCCAAATTGMDYARVQAISKSLCESVLHCEGDFDCCTRPPAPPSDHGPRPPPAAVRRFFIEAHDHRRMASDTTEGARHLSRMEELLLTR